MPVTSDMKLTYAKHVARWSDCTRCGLCRDRKNVVLCRGDLPCDVLFVGEAPGKSEDRLGYPFAGPAGILLDQIVDRALGIGLRTAFTNLIACIPLDDDGTKTGEPLPEDVKACSSRLQEIVQLADPRLIVCVGACAAHYTEPGKKYSVPLRCARYPQGGIPRLEVTHPAAILRANQAQQGFMRRKCLVQLRTVAEELLCR